MLEITVVWNPVRSPLSQHFDTALIDPVEDAKLIGPAGVVGGMQSAKFDVREEGREIVLTLGSLTYYWSCHCCSTDLFGPIILNSLLRNRK